MSALIVLLSPLVINTAMAAVKWLGSLKDTPSKRLWLAILSFIGVICYSVLTGNPVDPNSLSSLGDTVLQTLVAFLMSHGLYDLRSRARDFLGMGMAPDNLPAA